MNKLILLAISSILISSPVFAAGTHSGSHSKKHGHEQMAVGKIGETKDISGVIKILMKETDDGEMIFEPHAFKVARNATIRIAVENVGELEHELVLDNNKGIMQHKMDMENADGEMTHKDPNSLRLKPGEKGSIVWNFSNEGQFEFACLIPGHYEAGMKGNVSVLENTGTSTN